LEDSEDGDMWQETSPMTVQQQAGSQWLSDTIRDKRKDRALCGGADTAASVLKALRRDGFTRPLELAALDVCELDRIVKQGHKEGVRL
jgi:hypothetical protein